MSYLEHRVTFHNKIEALKSAIKKAPNNASLFNELAILYEKMGALEDAIYYYKEAIRRDINFVKAYNNIGVILYKQGRYQQAIEMFKLSLKVDSTFVSTYVNMGAACNKAGCYEEGEKALLQAIMIDDENSGAYANLGNIYNKMKRHDEARIQHEMALMLDNKSASNYANIGITFKNLGLYKEAKTALEKAIMIDPYFVNAHFDLATTYLMIGEYEKGFIEYEWRFKKPQMRPLLHDIKDILEKPLFTMDKESKNKRLLLYTEQGYGDILQFVRFAMVLKKKRPELELILHVRPALQRLLQEMPCFAEVVRRDEKVDDFDYQLALMSLPRLLNTTLHTLPTSPYIKLPKGKSIIGKSKIKHNIGIVWGASKTGESYEDKVFSLSYFQPLKENSAIQLYSLQVAGDVTQIDALGWSNEEIVNLEAKLTDFKETALAMKNLDLIITSDTSVAHLAGAMGKEAWVVLQKHADWRWELDSDTTRWYPSLKLFRQERQGDWQSAFEKVYRVLQKRLGL